MTNTFVNKLNEATQVLQQRQNRDPKNVYNVAAALQRFGLDLGGNEN